MKHYDVGEKSGSIWYKIRTKIRRKSRLENFERQKALFEVNTLFYWEPV